MLSLSPSCLQSKCVSVESSPTWKRARNHPPIFQPFFQGSPTRCRRPVKGSLSNSFPSSHPSLRYLNIQEFYSAQKSH